MRTLLLSCPEKSRYACFSYVWKIHRLITDAFEYFFCKKELLGQKNKHEGESTKVPKKIWTEIIGPKIGPKYCPLRANTVLVRPQKDILGQHRALSDQHGDVLSQTGHFRACTWPSQTNTSPFTPSKAPRRTTLVPFGPMHSGRTGGFSLLKPINPYNFGSMRPTTANYTPNCSKFIAERVCTSSTMLQAFSMCRNSMQYQINVSKCKAIVLWSI